MSLHQIKKGLDLPLLGKPEQTVDSGRSPTQVAVMADDFVGMKPRMRVQAGERVKLGQLLFEDKKLPGVLHTAPGAGTVVAIHRGARRALQSVVIELDRPSGSGEEDEAVSFESYRSGDVSGLNREAIQALLIESGLWTCLRARPFGWVADPAGTAHSIFVTAMDTYPLAPLVDVVLKGREADFERGLLAVSKLTEGKTFVCKAPGSSVPTPTSDSIQVEEFEGIHPAGTVGVHIHFLDPVHRDKTVWYLDYQAVIAIGGLFASGRLNVERVVALGGPSVKRPRLLRTRGGASTDDLVRDELKEGEHRVLAGPVFSGRTASGEILGYLGRYHRQISVLPEGRQREFLGWMLPGRDKFSTIRAYLSAFLPKKEYEFTTSTHGSPRAMVPIGMYEKVMPMDILPTFLLRSLVVGDVERAEELGCLELEEEDLDLCTFVCPGKTDYGPILLEVLTTIEKEG